MSLLRVIDFETTGLSAAADVLEVGWCDLDSETRQIGRRGSFLCGAEAIPPETRAVHHIRAEEIAGLPRYNRALWVERAQLDGVAAFVAHMADFEALFLTGSVPLVCSYKAALRIWPEAPSHGAFALLYWLEDQGLVSPDRQLAYPPHRAGPDSYATALLVAALYAAGMTSADLWRWTQLPRLLPRCTIGKFRGVAWPDVEGGFLEWMTRQADMEEDLKWNAKNEIDRRRALPPSSPDPAPSAAGRLL